MESDEEAGRQGGDGQIVWWTFHTDRHTGRQLMVRSILAIAAVLLVGFTTGCGLVFQGINQTVRIRTDPSGAKGSFAGAPFDSSPVELTVRRKKSDAVVRASKDGYHPTCVVVKQGSARALVLFDSIPVPLGLLFDAIIGTLPGKYPENISLTLTPVAKGGEPIQLPSDAELLAAHERHFVVCQPPAPPEEFWTAWFGMRLASVDRPAEPGRRYGAVERVGRIVREERAFSKFVYKDSNIGLTVVPVKDGIEFKLENLTSHAEKIVWDDVVFVDFDKTSHRVMHSGVRYIDRSLSQPPSVVAPKNLLKDIILPINRVSEASTAGFVHNPLFGTLIRECANESEAQFQARVEQLKGMPFGVLLPIEIAGVVNEYMLNFEIETVDLGKERGCPTRSSVAAQETIQRGDW
jgi:hypothetical protein